MKEHDIVYDKQGRAGRFVGMFGKKYIVCGLFMGDDGEEVTGPMEFWSYASTTPLREVVDEALAKARKQLSEVRSQVSSAQQELRDIDANRQRMLAKFKQFKALEHIEAFIDRRFTHLVIREYSSFTIVERENGLKQDPDHYHSDMRLLSLYGRSNGDLQWMVNKYADGSGADKECWPCGSIEEAQQMVKARIAEVLKTKSSAEWIAAADKFGVPVTRDMRIAAKERAIKDLQYNYDYAKRSFSEYQAKMDAAMAIVIPEEGQTQ